MKVYVRPTTFEADEVNVRLFSLGGRSLYPNEDVPSLSYLASVIGASGVGQFDELSLEKMALRLARRARWRFIKLLNAFSSRRGCVK